MTQKIIGLFILLVLGGCAGSEKIGCALQAFGAGVNAQPEPTCVARIRAQEAGLPPPAPIPAMHCWRDVSGKNLYCQPI